MFAISADEIYNEEHYLLFLSLSQTSARHADSSRDTGMYCIPKEDRMHDIPKRKMEGMADITKPFSIISIDD